MPLGFSRGHSGEGDCVQQQGLSIGATTLGVLLIVGGGFYTLGEHSSDAAEAWPKQVTKVSAQTTSDPKLTPPEPLAFETPQKAPGPSYPPDSCEVPTAPGTYICVGGKLQPGH
jgi:hypothetical protein